MATPAYTLDGSIPTNFNPNLGEVAPIKNTGTKGMMGGLASGFTGTFSNTGPILQAPLGGVNPNFDPSNSVLTAQQQSALREGMNNPIYANSTDNPFDPYISDTFKSMGMSGDFQGSMNKLFPNSPLNAGLTSGFTNTNANAGARPPIDVVQQPIINAYRQYLGREPDPAGLQAWTQALQENRITPDQLAENFMGSDEYKARQARMMNPTNPFQLSGFNPSFTGSTDPYTQAAQQTALANLAGAQQAVAANRVNQITPYANLQYEQTGTDANGNPIWTARQTVAPALQPGLEALQGRFAQTAGQEFNPQTPGVGINPSETYSEAIMRRLQPELQRQTEALDTRLANQGIMPGSEAYNRAKTLQAQKQNDLLTAAQVGGINVGLQANQQAYNQALQRYNLPLTQLGAFQQATQPSYINPPAQAAVAGPDYLGAYTTSQAAQIAAQNAAAARQANLTSGLFGLGSSAILSGGLPALGRGLAGLFSSTPSSSGFVGLDPGYAAQLGLYGGSGLNTAGAAGDVLSGLF